MRRRLFGMIAAVALLATSAAAQPSFRDTLTETVYARGFERPTAMAFTPDGGLLVAEQDGNVWLVSADATVTLVTHVDTAWEYTGRGLLGIALHPGFADNGFLYLYYTVYGGDTRNVLARVALDGAGVAPGSEALLVTFDAQATNRHTGGAMHFGPDGMLYIGVGDNAVPSNAQSLDTRFGKILRYAPDGSIPADGPFAGQAAGENAAIWALGLRNPFTFAFDPDSGAMYINDVGEESWEEVNAGEAGANYGWPRLEGPSVSGDARTPLHAFPHDAGRCAATGAVFYADTRFPPALLGDYLFAELCTSTIYALDRQTGLVLRVMQTRANNPVDLDVGPDGAVYALSHTTGTVVRIAYREAEE